MVCGLGSINKHGQMGNGGCAERISSHGSAFCTPCRPQARQVSACRKMRMGDALGAKARVLWGFGAQMHVWVGVRAVSCIPMRKLFWNRKYIGKFLAHMPKSGVYRVCSKRLANDQLWCNNEGPAFPKKTPAFAAYSVGERNQDVDFFSSCGASSSCVTWPHSS